MNRFTIMSNRELRTTARKYNSEAARQEAHGTRSVWQPYAQWVEDILDELECRIGIEATELFRGKLAESHAKDVTSCQHEIEHEAEAEAEYQKMLAEL